MARSLNLIMYIARIDKPGKTTITITGRLNSDEPVVLCNAEYVVRTLSAK